MDEDDEFFDEIMEFLDSFHEEYEEEEIIYDFDWYYDNHIGDHKVEAESEDAKFWREMAEKYEEENGLHRRFQNLLLIQLMANGGLGVLGTKGMWN